MWIHGLPNGFRDLGHEVNISGPITASGLSQLLKNVRPQLIVSLGWTLEHRARKRQIVKRLVGKSSIPHVFWATEDPTHHETFSAPYVKTVRPDFVFTICRSKIQAYRKMGIPAAHMDFGFHRSVHRRGPVQKRLKASIALVANGYSHILRKYPRHYRIRSIKQLISPLVQDRTRIDFYGRQWGEMKPILGAGVPQSWIHGYLPYPDAHKVYNSAQIVLAPQNHLTQVTQRTYEILGSGGFLLTSDTPEIRRLFTPGKDLVVSRSAAHTRELVQYYLKHPAEREQIRRQGYKAVRKHSYKHRARYMLACLKKQKLI